MTSYMSLAQLTVDVTAEGEFPTNIRPIRVIFDFSEDVQGFTIDDITVSNAILDDFRVDISDRQYSVAVNPTNPIGLDTIRVSVGANVATVLGGTEGNEPSNVLEFLFDAKSPAILAVNAPDTIFSMEPYTVQVVFDEPVEPFNLDAFRTENGTIENFIFNGPLEDTITFDVRPSVTGGVINVLPVFVDLSDSLGNIGGPTLSVVSTVIDLESPLFDLGILTNERSNSTPIKGQLIFSEPVEVPDLGDITATNATLSNLRQVTYGRIADAAEPGSGSDVLLDQDGNIWVADANFHQVRKYDRDGELLTSIGKKGVIGSANDEFYGPIGMDMDLDGNIYVADALNGRVQVFNNNGDFVKSIPINDLSVPILIDVAIEPHEERIFVCSQRKIYILDFEGNEVARIERDFGDPLDEDVTRPSSVTVDTVNNRLFVLSLDTQELLYLYDLEGVLLSKSTRGLSGFITNVSLFDKMHYNHHDQRLYCSFSASATVAVTSAGVSAGLDFFEDFYGMRGRQGNDEGVFSGPTAVAFDQTNKMFVMNSENGDISVVNIGNERFENLEVNSRPGFGITYEFDIVPGGNGTVSVSAAAGAFRDLLGNATAGIQSVSIQYDVVPPTISLASSTPNATGDTISVTLDFSEPVTIKDVASLVVTNGSVVEEKLVPFNFEDLSVYQVLGTFGQAGEEAFQFDSPADIISDSKGNIYISDFDNGRVSIFDRAGNYLAALVKGTGQDEFGPAFMTIDDNDQLYVTDADEGGVAVFNPDFSLARTFAEDILEPAGIDRDSDGNLYIAGDRNPFVRIYDAQGDFVRNLGYGDTDLGRDTVSFINVKISPSGQVHLLEETNPVIYVFEKEGSFSRLIDLKEILPGMFPDGPDDGVQIFDIEFGKNGELFLTITGSRDVLALNSSGELIDRLENVIEATDVSALTSVVGLHLDRSGVLYVADLDNSRVVSYANLVESVSFSVVPSTYDVVNLSIASGEVVDGFGNVNTSFTAELRSSVVTSLEETQLAQNRARLYPNPAHDRLFIALTGDDAPQGNYSLTITGASGKISERYEIGTQLPSLDVSHLPAGVYMINVNMTNSTETLRFLKLD